MKDQAITEEEADLLKKKLDDEEQGVEFVEGDKSYYLGYCPIESNHTMLICIVPKSVVDNVLKDYSLPFYFIVFPDLVLRIRKQRMRKETMNSNYSQ